ncbi:alpha/beta fold hydrolase [Gordonia humi]|uniref:Pimeloyl-ACP methyl ester carboxylesterase n=1 Tax=Gordonia humi TaxID=686429 RepID=A0A840F491_9ACTN|nr:alpha/beta hydrolase [Gordonia humi]MBB4135090.1 pimeloyl-ACP methyl ester carboxylesterase [Gordonia humi]
MPILDHPAGPVEYVRHDGDPDLPTMVFLHEGLGSAGQWGALPLLLARATGAPALVYSRHGYGGSAGSGPDGPDYLHREAFDTLPQILDALSIARPILIGHSDGASIAAIHASAHPVTSAVLIAPHIVVEQTTLDGIAHTASVFAETVRPSLGMFHDDPDELFRRWSGVWCSPEFASFDVTGLLPHITAPVLVVQGEADQYGTDVQISAVTDHVVGDVTAHLLPGTGHHPHLDDAEAIAALVGEFLQPFLSLSV